MPVNNGKGTPNKGAGKIANKKTLGPGGSFPAGDKKHQRLAISGATSSYNAGNISKSTETKIQGEARSLLHPHKNLGKFLHPKKKK